MPLKVDRTCGHIDHFIEAVFGCPIEELDTAGIVADGDRFEKLCRVIMLTEQRGMAQVEILLKNSHVRSDPVMKKIFTIVEKDEPDHWMPYHAWLTAQRPGHRAVARALGRLLDPQVADAGQAAGAVRQPQLPASDELAR